MPRARPKNRCLVRWAKVKTAIQDLATGVKAVVMVAVTVEVAMDMGVVLAEVATVEEEGVVRVVDHQAWVEEVDQVHIMDKVETMQMENQRKRDVTSAGSLPLVIITITIDFA